MQCGAHVTMVFPHVIVPGHATERPVYRRMRNWKMPVISKSLVRWVLSWFLVWCSQRVWWLQERSTGTMGKVPLDYLLYLLLLLAFGNVDMRLPCKNTSNLCHTALSKNSKGLGRCWYPLRVSGKFHHHGHEAWDTSRSELSSDSIHFSVT